MCSHYFNSRYVFQTMRTDYFIRQTFWIRIFYFHAMLKQVILFLRVQETDYFIFERFFRTQNHFVYVSFSCRFRVLWTYLLHNNGVLWWHITPKLDFFKTFWSFWTQNLCVEHKNIIILLFCVIFLKNYRNSEKILVSELFPELKMTVSCSFQRVPFHKNPKTTTFRPVLVLFGWFVLCQNFT